MKKRKTNRKCVSTLAWESMTEDERAAETIRYIKGRCTVEPGDDCWIWRGSAVRNLYPCFLYHGMTSPYRSAWEAFYKKKIAKNLYLIPTVCENRLCCNPEHYKLTNRLGAMQRAAKNGRMCSGIRRSISQMQSLTKKRGVLINMEIARKIRARAAQENIKQNDLALEYGLSRAQISSIINNRRWREPSLLACSTLIGVR